MNIIKMRPSHRSVIKAMVKTFHPETVVECGCGPNSTPLWSETCKKVVGIEHNPEWIEEIKDKCGKNVTFAVKVFWDLKYNTYPHKMTLAQRRQIFDYFTSLPVENPDILFVDSFAGVRVYALIAMAKNAGITMYHDTEGPKYWYRYFEEKLPTHFPDGYRHYSYRPRCQPKILKQEPCTDIIFRPEHYSKIDEFTRNLTEEHNAYYLEMAGIKKAGMEFVLVASNYPMKFEDKRIIGQVSLQELK